MIKIVGLVIISLLLIIFLKGTKKEFALIVTIAVACVLFFWVANDMYAVVQRLYSLTTDVGEINSYISLMIKILGVSLISQFVVDLCRDSGEHALASQTEVASKVIILTMTFPLFETVINIVTGLLK